VRFGGEEKSRPDVTAVMVPTTDALAPVVAMRFDHLEMLVSSCGGDGPHSGTPYTAASNNYLQGVGRFAEYRL